MASSSKGRVLAPTDLAAQMQMMRLQNVGDVNEETEAMARLRHTPRRKGNEAQLTPSAGAFPIMSRAIPALPKLPLSARRSHEPDDPDVPRAMKFVHSARQRPAGYLPRIHQEVMSARRATDAAEEDFSARVESRIGVIPGPGRRSDVLGHMGKAGRGAPPTGSANEIELYAGLPLPLYSSPRSEGRDRAHLDALWNNRIVPVLLPAEKRDMDMMVFALEQVLCLTPFSVARAHGELSEVERAEAYKNADELFRWTFHELYKRVPVLQHALQTRCPKCKVSKDIASSTKKQLKDMQALVEREKQLNAEARDEMKRLEDAVALAKSEGGVNSFWSGRSGMLVEAALGAERAKAEKFLALQGAMQSAIDGGYARRNAIRDMDSSVLKDILRERGEAQVHGEQTTQTDRIPPLGDLDDPTADDEGRRLLYDENGNAYYGVTFRGEKILAYDGERMVMGWDAKGRPIYEQGSLGKDANGYDIIGVDEDGRNILAWITGPDGVLIPVYGYDTESGRAIIGYDANGNPIFEDNGASNLSIGENIMMRQRLSALGKKAQAHVREQNETNFLERLGASGFDAQGRLVDKDGNPLDLSALSHEDLLIVSRAMQEAMAKAAAETEWYRAGEKHGIVSMKLPQYAVMESNIVVSASIERSRGSEGEVSVRYTTVDHTAKQGVDYEPQSGELMWMDGELGERSIEIPVMNNDYSEGNRVFYISLHETSGGASLSLDRHTAMVVVIDDDGAVLDFQSAVQGGSVNLAAMLDERQRWAERDAQKKKLLAKRQNLLGPGESGFLPASWLKFLGVGSIAELKGKGTKTMSPKMFHGNLHQISHALVTTLPLKDKLGRCYAGMVEHVVEFARQSYGIKAVAVDKLGTLVRTLEWAGQLGVDNLAGDFLYFCGIQPGRPQAPQADVLVYLDILQLMSENCTFQRGEAKRFWAAMEKGEVVSLSPGDLVEIVHGIFPDGGWDAETSTAAALAGEVHDNLHTIHTAQTVPMVLHAMLVAFQETRPQRLAAATSALGAVGQSSALTFAEFMQRSTEVTCYANRELFEEAFEAAAKRPHPRHELPRASSDEEEDPGREIPKMHYDEVDPEELQRMDSAWVTTVSEASSALVDRVPCLVGSSRFQMPDALRASAVAYFSTQPQ